MDGHSFSVETRTQIFKRLLSGSDNDLVDFKKLILGGFTFFQGDFDMKTLIINFQIFRGSFREVFKVMSW